jgi:cytochrome P450
MDLVADDAAPLPMMVIAELIGIPAEEWARFREWSNLILVLSHIISALRESSDSSSTRGPHLGLTSRLSLVYSMP